ncbi:MAG TPA: hypothetical protein VNK89_08195 [Thermoflexus sp.]|nr:hypothetical protein [Thermoflexus sp.]
MAELDWFCLACGAEGQIWLQDELRPVAVRCANCGHLSAHLWCEACGVGGQIAHTDFNQRPSAWRCSECGWIYPLPPSFYEEVIEFRPMAFAGTRPAIHPEGAAPVLGSRLLLLIIVAAGLVLALMILASAR